MLVGLKMTAPTCVDLQALSYFVFFVPFVDADSYSTTRGKNMRVR